MKVYNDRRRKTKEYRERQKELQKIWKERNPDYQKNYKRINKEYTSEYNKSYRLIHIKEERARRIFTSYVNSGKILRPYECSKCGKIGRMFGHHFDYDKPLEVIWLCGSCHRILHYRLKN